MDIKALTSLVLLASTAAADTPVGPACVETPQGAPPAVAECYANECKAYKVAVAACNGDTTCIQLAYADYGNNLLGCWPVAVPNSREWATIWYADGEYGVAFDLWDVPEHATRFGF